MSEQIQGEIEKRLGFFPPFFFPALETPEILKNLWEQTLSAYIENPLPALFKEKLFAYLSRYCTVPYSIICHSCALRPLGMTAMEVLLLLETPPPTEKDLESYLSIISAEPETFSFWPETGSETDRALLSCSIFIFLNNEQAGTCRAKMRHYLGNRFYNHLIAFLGYIKTCHQWIESHPDITFEADRRAKENLKPLIKEEPGLLSFFKNYREWIEREQKRRVRETLAEAEVKKRVEAEMLKSGERFRVISELISDYAFCHNVTLEGEIVLEWITESFTRRHGYTVEEINSIGWPNLIYPDDLPIIFKQAERALSGQSDVSEYRFINKNGEVRWIRSYVQPIWNAGEGRVTRIYGATQDITERKLADEALSKSEARFRRLYDSNVIGICIIDFKGRILEANDALLETIGYTREDLLSGELRWDSITPPEYRHLDERALAEIGRFGACSTFEKEFIRKDGSRVPILIGGAGLEDSPDGGIGFVLDLSERKRAEEERNQLLQNQQRWLESILNLAPSPILLIEPATARVTFANKAADYLAGGEFPKGIRAEEYHDFYYCTDSEGNRIPNEQMPWIRAALGEPLDGFEMDWHTPLGKISLLIFADTIPAMHGYPATSVLVFQNITQLKQIEKELRTANRMKDEFLATVSHELRTPLTAILGWAKLLRDGGMDDETFDRAIDTIERNAHAQSRLVEDLLDVSRIITGKIHLENRLFDLATVVDASLSTIRTAADARRITLKLFREIELKPVFGDPARLQQVIWNLLSNAVKFTPIGGYVEVRIEQNDQNIEIEVSDTGQGISPDFLPFVFDKFRQADSTTTRKHGGLGLGLAIVRYLVELHGGTVEAESDGIGRGSTFTVNLPLAKAAAEEAAVRILSLNKEE